MLAAEPRGDAMTKRLDSFRSEVILSKLRLIAMLRDLKEKGARVAHQRALAGKHAGQLCRPR